MNCLKEVFLIAARAQPSAGARLAGRLISRKACSSERNSTCPAAGSNLQRMQTFTRSLSASIKSFTHSKGKHRSISSRRRLVLLDAFAVLYRAHFSFGPTARLTTTGGEDTSVLYGFLSVLLALLEAQPAPTHFGVVLDAGGSAWGAKNFRSVCRNALAVCFVRTDKSVNLVLLSDPNVADSPEEVNRPSSEREVCFAASWAGAAREFETA